jgi:ABC-type dipeptide/oligopeptide/nickel transport system permease component
LVLTIMVLNWTFIIEILYGLLDPRIKAAQAG